MVGELIGTVMNDENRHTPGRVRYVAGILGAVKGLCLVGCVGICTLDVAKPDRIARRLVGGVIANRHRCLVGVG